MFFSHFFKILILFVISIFTISCSSNLKYEDNLLNTSGASNIRNAENMAYLLKQPVKKVLGKWQGFMYCTNINYLFDMKVTKSANNTITAKFNSKLYFYQSGDSTSGAYPSNLKLNLYGRYFPDQSMFILRTQGRDKKKRMFMKGVIDPASPHFIANVVMRHYGACSMALAGKDDIEDILEDIREVSEFKTNLFYHPSGSNRCDGAMKQWVEKVIPITIFDYDYRDPKASGRIKYIALEILQDKYFKPYYKKSFTELSESEMGGFYRKLVNGCSAGYFKKQSSLNVLKYIFMLVQNQKALPRSELLMYPYTKQILSNWKKSAIRQLKTLSPSESQRLSIIASSILSPLWPSEIDNIKEELILTNKEKSGDKMLSELNVKLANKIMTFGSLAQLASFVENFANAHSTRAGGADTKTILSAHSIKEANKLIKDTFDKNIILRAKELTHKIYSVDGILKYLTLVGQGEYRGLYKALDVNQIKEVNKLFEEKKYVLLTTFAGKEINNYASISSRGKGLPLIRTLNNYEIQLSKHYKYLLKNKAFANFNNKRAQYRTQVLSSNKVLIHKKFISTHSISQLDNTYNALLLETDRNTAAGSDITVYYNQQRHIIAPFLEYPGGEYLDAVYRGDFSALRSQDSRYGRQLSENFNQAIQGLAPRSKNPYSLKPSENKMTLIKPISAVYLFNYQDFSKRCLKPDYAEFTVVKRVPGTVTTNLLGWEVSRTYGYSTSNKFRVNKVFEKLFRIVGNSSPNSFSAGFTDSLLGSGLMQEVIRSTKHIMREFDCNGKVIKKFEKNMRRYALGRLR